MVSCQILRRVSILLLHELIWLPESNDLQEEIIDDDPSLPAIEDEDVQEAFDRLKKRTASAIGTPKVHLLHYHYCIASICKECSQRATFSNLNDP